MLGYGGNNRNPLVVLIFGFIGMLFRFLFFTVFNRIVGNPHHKVAYFSNGAKQIIYNVLVSLVFFFAMIYGAVFFLWENLHHS